MLLTSKIIKNLFLTIVPALLIVLLTIHMVNKNKNEQTITSLPGKPLAAYEELYPIDIKNGQLSLNKDKFMKAVEYFSDNSSPKAIADLIYFGQSNNVSLLLNQDEQIKYKKILSSPINDDLKIINNHRDKKFQVYIDIVNGIGKTFSGTNTEIVLHDTRNPLKSVVAIQNPISNRRLGDSTTNFGIQLIKDYSILNSRGESYISYPLTLKDGRNIKSSTIPLFDDKYGLIGFICLNIDISELSTQTIQNATVSNFIENFVSVINNQKINELIENTKVHTTSLTSN